MSYDAAGNQLSDGVNTYTYDAEGNVTAVNTGNTGQYVYDALNHRVSTKTSAGTYEYLFDAQGRRTSTWPTSTNAGVEGRIYWDNQQIAYRALNGQTFFEHKTIWAPNDSGPAIKEQKRPLKAPRRLVMDSTKLSP